MAETDGRLQTPLDHAHAAIGEGAEDPRRWLGFYGRLCAGELFLLLRAAARGGSADPAILPHEGQDHALAFDTEARLQAFAEGPAHWVSMPGADLVRLLARQGLGLGLNLGVAPSAVLLPPDALGWLAGQIAGSLQQVRALPRHVAPPLDMPPALVDALARRLAGVAGLVSEAWLVQARYADAPDGLLLACVGVALPARAVLIRSLAPAAHLAPAARPLDIVCLEDDAPVLAALRRHGLRFEIPSLPGTRAGQGAPAGPGMVPDRPPKLR